MKLQTIFDQLTAGELSQVKLGGDQLGEISENDYSKVVSHINLGLTELHKRFVIKEGSVLLTLDPTITTYVLDSKYAVSNEASQEAIKYITDSNAVPFEDELFKVERVYDDEDYELPLNVYDDDWSVLTPTYKTLIPPRHEDFDSLTLLVKYRANHRILTSADWATPTTTEVELPYTYLEALLLYIGSRVMNPIGFAGGNGFHEGNNYATKFEQACILLEMQNYRVDQRPMSSRAAANYWP